MVPTPTSAAPPSTPRSPAGPPRRARRRRTVIGALLLAAVVAAGAVAWRARPSPAQAGVALVGAAARGAAVAAGPITLSGPAGTVRLTSASENLARAPRVSDLGVHQVPAGDYRELTAVVGGRTRTAPLTLSLTAGGLTPLLLVSDGGGIDAYAGNEAVNLGLQLAGGTAVRLPDVTLTDERGVSTPLQARLQGRVTVLASFTSHCHDSCPLYAAVLGDLQRTASARGWDGRLQVLEATMDPGRDTPAELAAFARMTGTSWPLMTGDPGAIGALWGALHAGHRSVPFDGPAPVDWYTGRPEAYDVQHDSVVAVVDGHGDAVFSLLGNPRLGHDLTPQLDHLLQLGGRSAASLEALSSWSLTDLLDRVDVVMGQPAESARAVEQAAHPGAPAPDFTLPQPGGGRVRLSSLVGQPVLVNFWATWCGPCRTELPRLARAVRDHPGLRVLAVDEGEGAAAVRGFLAGVAGGSRLTALLDADRSAGSRYALQGLPVSVLVDAGGTVRAVHVGELGDGDLAALLRTAGV